MYLQKCADTLHPNLSDFCHYIRFYRICRRKPHKRIFFSIPLTSMRGEFFRIRYCSQELVCEAIVAPRTLPNYAEAILLEQQKQKNLSELIYVESCHATAQGRTLFLTERLAQTGLLHLVAVIAIGESYMFCNSYAGQVHSAMGRSVSILSA